MRKNPLLIFVLLTISTDRRRCRTTVADHQGDITRIDHSFAPSTSLLFADGFETADLTGWSNSVP